MKLRALSPDAYAGRRWKKPSAYTFAAADRTTPVVLKELAPAALAMPLAFLKGQTTSYVMVAVMGFDEGKNLFVADNGRWLGGYIPASYRTHPFHHVKTDGKYLVAVDEDSGLISDTEGEPFFEDGKLSKAVDNVAKFLEHVVTSREASLRICDLLDKHGLMQPWPLKVNTPEGERELSGLYCVNEAKLRELSSEAFDELRQAGALPLIYCQLLSMQNMVRLGQLGALRKQVAEKAAEKQRAASAKSSPNELDLSFLDSNMINVSGR
jgi:hypothetical protein